MNDDTGPARIGFWDLPLDVISTHVLKSDFLPETADLGRLRAVSKGMRDAVDATEREIKKLSDDEAVDLGNVTLLKDRHSRGVLKDECLTCAAAARNGDLEELKALRAENFPWNEWTCAYAADSGHFETLKWASENGCPWSERTCWYAAEYGHLEVLKWARANGCPWDKYTCEYAAQAGHFDVLKWARENGCPWDEWTCMYAARSGLLPSSP